MENKGQDPFELIKYALVTIVICVPMFLAINYLLPGFDQPLQGNCGTGWIAKDESSPFEYDGDQVVCKVIVKAGSQGQEDACYGFKYPLANQTDGCYNVKGLGSNSVVVTGGGSSPECKEISHVEFYGCATTDTPTSTSTSPPSEETAPPSPSPTTPTATNTRPAQSTFTPTPWTETPTSESPTETPGTTELPPTVTSTSEGPTPTQTVGTATSTGTASPPKPKRSPTGTGLVVLPATGLRGTSDNDGGAWLGVILVVMLIAVVVIEFVRGARQS